MFCFCGDILYLFKAQFYRQDYIWGSNILIGIRAIALVAMVGYWFVRKDRPDDEEVDATGQ